MDPAEILSIKQKIKWSHDFRHLITFWFTLWREDIKNGNVDNNCFKFILNGLIKNITTEKPPMWNIVRYHMFVTHNGGEGLCSFVFCFNPKCKLGNVTQIIFSKSLDYSSYTLWKIAIWNVAIKRTTLTCCCNNYIYLEGTSRASDTC